MAERLQENVSQMRLPGKVTQSKALKRRRTAYFHFLKGSSGCPEEHGPQGPRLDTKVFPSWRSRAEGSDGGLDSDSSRQDGQKSTDLREMWEDTLDLAKESGGRGKRWVPGGR